MEDVIGKVTVTVAAVVGTGTTVDWHRDQEGRLRRYNRHACEVKQRRSHCHCPGHRRPNKLLRKERKGSL